jgi:hypothetical protein
MVADVVCAVLVLCSLVAENAELRCGTVADLRRELELIWLEFAYMEEEES